MRNLRFNTSEMLVRTELKKIKGGEGYELSMYGTCTAECTSPGHPMPYMVCEGTEESACSAEDNVGCTFGNGIQLSC